MNTVTGTVAIDRGAYWVTVGDHGRLRLPDAGPVTGLADGGKVTVGVRAEHLVTTDDDTSSLEGEVTAVEWLGHERHVLLRIGDERLVMRQHGADVAPDVGAFLRLTAEPLSLHLFDPATDERLS